MCTLSQCISTRAYFLRYKQTSTYRPSQWFKTKVDSLEDMTNPTTRIAKWPTWWMQLKDSTIGAFNCNKHSRSSARDNQSHHHQQWNWWHDDNQVQFLKLPCCHISLYILRIPTEEVNLYSGDTEKLYVDFTVSENSFHYYALYWFHPCNHLRPKRWAVHNHRKHE